MKSITNLLAGLLLTGVLVFAPSRSFARGGGGGGGHFGGGGGHLGAFHGGFSSGGSGARSHHWYPGSYGYFSPFEYGLEDDTGYYDDSDSPDLQPATNDGAPDQSTSLIMSVQNELAQLGYYHGPIDGIAGSETGRAVRWFQAIDHLPVTGQIDSATRQALGVA
jgi:Putative peptidoglycan binding domain